MPRHRRKKIEVPTDREERDEREKGESKRKERGEEWRIESGTEWRQRR